MVLILSLRKGNNSYIPECFVDLPLDVAVKHTADIATEVMKYDEDVADVIVYTKRTFDLKTMSEKLSDIPVMYHTFDFLLKK